jgi:hypothetical protein
MMEREVAKITDHLEHLLLSDEEFTGKIELNFKDGILKDINETKRTKME